MTEQHVCVPKRVKDPEYLGVGALVTRCAICSVDMSTTHERIQFAEFREELRQSIVLGSIDPRATDVGALMKEVIEQRETLRRSARWAIDRHIGEARPAMYGRSGTMELRCKECNKPSPCPSWLAANDALEAVK